MARLQEQYVNEIAPALNKKFGYKSVMQIPKLDKVIINVAAGEAKENATVIDATLAGLRAADDEPARAWAVWQRKFGTLPSSPQERARQTRFLASRGFRHDTIRKVLSGSLANPDGDGNSSSCTEDGPWR